MRELPRQRTEATRQISLALRLRTSHQSPIPIPPHILHAAPRSDIGGITIGGEGSNGDIFEFRTFKTKELVGHGRGAEKAR
eukprot:scaffold29453_cov96-Isochrysis_galbana.AAC.2